MLIKWGTAIVHPLPNTEKSLTKNITDWFFVEHSMKLKSYINRAPTQWKSFDNLTCSSKVANKKPKIFIMVRTKSCTQNNSILNKNFEVPYVYNNFVFLKIYRNSSLFSLSLPLLPLMFHT